MATTIEEVKTAARLEGSVEKYLTFTLGEEEYGLEILKVREIIGMMKITRVPRMPGFVLGVINLRGKVIPVMDLRLKFGMQYKENTELTCIIVVELEDMLMGVVVDRVFEVANIDSGNIEETPSFGVDVDTEYITGIGKVGDRVIILLDVDRVLSADEILKVAESAQSDSHK